MKFTKQEQESILECFRFGLSSRKICKKLGWDVTRKTSVNRFLLPYRQVGLQELEVLPSTQEVVSHNKPRILFWDLECSILEGYFFRLWKENIPYSRVTKQQHLLCAQWAFDNEPPTGVRVSVQDVKTSNDFDVVVKMIEAINQADLIVTFNGKRFDTKLLNTRALYWGLPPIKRVKHIDLMEQAKKVFRFPSNSMQNISMYLGEKGKIATGGTRLWERCAEYENVEECEKALVEMFDYGLQDINATRDLYKRFQGWMVGVPNLGTITNVLTGNKTLRCIHCGSDDIFPMDDKTYTAVSSFELYRCGNTDCRGISRITANGKNLTAVV